MKLEILEVKMVCGCCLEKTPEQPVVLHNQEGSLILEMPDANGVGKSLLLHLSFRAAKKTKKA